MMRLVLRRFSSVKIVEVSPRDGIQSELRVLTVSERVKMIKLLERYNPHKIEVGSFLPSGHAPQMINSDLVAKQVDMNNKSMLVSDLEGLERAVACKAKEIALPASVSEEYSQRRLGSPVKEHLERYKEVCEAARVHGLAVRGYISNIFGCPYNLSKRQDSLFDQVVSMAKYMAVDLSCYEISLADSNGHGTPEYMRALIRLLCKEVPKEMLAVHLHDTFGMALANLQVALEEGIRIVDCSALGLGGCSFTGESKGILATERVLYLLWQSKLECKSDIPEYLRIYDELKRTVSKEKIETDGLVELMRRKIL